MNRAFAWMLFFVSLGALVYVETQAQAQALQLAKPFSGKVNKAVATALSNRLNTMGFAVNDPVYTATMAASETVLGGAVAAGSVAATVAAVGSSPVWLSVALGIGAAYEIYDWGMGTNRWKAEAGEKVAVAPDFEVVAPAVVIPPSAVDWVTPPVSLPIDWSVPGLGYKTAYPSDLPICAKINPYLSAAPVGAPVVQAWYVVCGHDIAEVQALGYVFFQNFVIRKLNFGVYNITAMAPTGAETNGTVGTCVVDERTCPYGHVFIYDKSYSGTYWNGSTNVAFTAKDQTWAFTNPAYIEPGKQMVVNDAASTLTDGDLGRLADVELLAAIANRIWQQAAQQPGYAGAPYDAQNPVTGADILAGVAAGLYPHPTISDLLALVAAVGSSPALDPNAQPVESTAGDVQVDFGPDPGIASPALEDAPTGQSIVDHVIGFLPSISAFTIPAHTGTCDMPDFEFFSHQMSMDGACDIIEPHRALLSTLFSAIWGVAALFVVLRA